MSRKIHLTASQGEKLRELGSYLHEIRRKQALSLEEVSQKTRIQVRLLRAIEEADTNVLPEPIYIRALIKQFADALELNGADFASAFPTQYQVKPMKPAWRESTPTQLRPFHLYWIYIAVLVSAVSGLSMLVQKSNLQLAGDNPPVDSLAPLSDDTAQPSSQQISPTIEAVNRLENSLNPNTLGENNPVSNRVVVSMKLQDDCWLRVVADGAVAYEGILQKGEERTWEAEKSLKITAGNAGGVVITFNNEEARPLGSPGAVQTVTYQTPNPQS
ncbi:helix-turn-helix domain-containing protein [Spirulina subsalsa]|uniref:helix-turn-helix domain-containing protein n=1 Tax=Spirulina subsalsa TaxID=54311 RepID=UPI00030FA0B9|nr:RodZ domain-containing protein [Spirulina subsalsa]